MRADSSSNILIKHADTILQIGAALACNIKYQEMKIVIDNQFAHCVEKYFNAYFPKSEPLVRVHKDQIVLVKTFSGQYATYQVDTNVMAGSLSGDFVGLTDESGEHHRARIGELYLAPIHDYDLISLAIQLNEFSITGVSGLTDVVYVDGGRNVYLATFEVEALDRPFVFSIEVYRENNVIEILSIHDSGDFHILETDQDDYDSILMRSLVESIGHFDEFKMHDIGLSLDQAKIISSILEAE